MEDQAQEPPDEGEHDPIETPEPEHVPPPLTGKLNAGLDRDLYKSYYVIPHSLRAEVLGFCVERSLGQNGTKWFWKSTDGRLIDTTEFARLAVEKFPALAAIVPGELCKALTDAARWKARRDGTYEEPPTKSGRLTKLEEEVGRLRREIETLKEKLRDQGDDGAGTTQVAA